MTKEMLKKNTTYLYRGYLPFWYTGRTKTVGHYDNKAGWVEETGYEFFGEFDAKHVFTEDELNKLTVRGW